MLLVREIPEDGRDIRTAKIEPGLQHGADVVFKAGRELGDVLVLGRLRVGRAEEQCARQLRVVAHHELAGHPSRLAESFPAEVQAPREVAQLCGRGQPAVLRAIVLRHHRRADDQ